ncbi:hypothetical protein [Notoacmeibacter sp. MSK16QG-6]|uniref:hypothetical protein n=1 Tax=Notoacmeibacter sp. MSK16QG-6 TaxID=2957982 RepID=UPI00209F431D|nr:hypothetical protein [Notoacmeibacter sp. MSK16QG-6]MCP1201117.1 hypothetical protein [Notoacmeibacter sp. MSK16QG-6]
MRQLLLGVAIGLIAGIYVAPMLGRPGLSPEAVSQSMEGLVSSVSGDLAEDERPSDDEAKRAVFSYRDWDIAADAGKSSVRVRRCISVKAGIACAMQLELWWVENPHPAEAIFEHSNEEWHIVRMTWK